MPGLRQIFLQHIAQTSDIPLSLEIVRAEGIYLYDNDGKSYIDMIAGIGVSALGHRHPKVVEAIHAQTDAYLHTMVYGEFVLSPQVKLAKLLTEHLPDPLDSVYLVNSGSEATEGAMKLAKRYTGRPNIISGTKAYHGSTQGAASLMWPTEFSQAFYPLLPGIDHIDFNHVDDLYKINKNTAAVILEPVQAEAGVYPPKAGYLEAVRKRCDEVGALLIFDEVQTGMGRTGSLFAAQKYGVTPDIMTLAKGLGGGMPIGAFVASNEIMQSLSHDPTLGHITTFGGHPVSSAAAHATLQFLLESKLIQQVDSKSKYVYDKLSVHPKVKEVRNSGLLLAVELDSFTATKKVIDGCVEKGLLTDWFLFNDKCLRLAPPLTIMMDELELACEILIQALDAL